MPDSAPVPPEKRKQLLKDAFLLGIGSIAFGITAIPAIVQSIRCLRWMRGEKPGKLAYFMVIFSLVFSTGVLGSYTFIVCSFFSGVREMGKRTYCISKMKGVGLAIRVYAQNNSDRFPSAKWCDDIVEDSTEYFGTNCDITQAFHCPSTPKRQFCGYAMNRRVVGKYCEQIPVDTVLLFESDAGWNAVGGPEIAAHHHVCMNVILADGSVQEVLFDEIGKLRWNPDKNTPAK